MRALLYATTLGRTATVVGKRRNVDNLGNLDTHAVHGADCRFTSVTGTLHIGFHLAETKIVSDLAAILGCHLGSIGGVLLRATFLFFHTLPAYRSNLLRSA